MCHILPHCSCLCLLPTFFSLTALFQDICCAFICCRNHLKNVFMTREIHMKALSCQNDNSERQKKFWFSSHRAYVTWRWNQRTKVNTEMHIGDKSFTAYLTLFLCFSLTLKYWKQLSMCCLNAPVIFQNDTHEDTKVRGMTSQLGKKDHLTHEHSISPCVSLHIVSSSVLVLVSHLCLLLVFSAFLSMFTHFSLVFHLNYRLIEGIYSMFFSTIQNMWNNKWS